MSPKKISPQKSATVENLSDLVSQAKSIAVVDYSGLKVNQATQLRQAIRKAGGQFIVTKNTLFKIALNQKDLDLTGLNAFVFSLTDEISALKAVSEFAKKNSLLPFKMGILNDQVLTSDQISTLSSLPGKDVLIAQTAGSLKSPLFGLVYSLNWNISKLVRTLDTIVKTKG